MFVSRGLKAILYGQVLEALIVIVFPVLFFAGVDEVYFIGVPVGMLIVCKMLYGMAWKEIMGIDKNARKVILPGKRIEWFMWIGPSFLLLFALLQFAKPLVSLGHLLIPLFCLQTTMRLFQFGLLNDLARFVQLKNVSKFIAHFNPAMCLLLVVLCIVKLVLILGFKYDTVELTTWQIILFCTYLGLGTVLICLSAMVNVVTFSAIEKKLE